MAVPLGWNVPLYKCCPQTVIKQLSSSFQHWIFPLSPGLFKLDYFQMHSILCLGAQNSLTLWLLHAFSPFDIVSLRSIGCKWKKMEVKWLQRQERFIGAYYQKVQKWAGLRHDLFRVLLSFFVILYSLLTFWPLMVTR